MAYRKSYRRSRPTRARRSSGGRRVSRRSYGRGAPRAQTVRILLQTAQAPAPATLTPEGLMSTSPPPARRKF